MDMVKIIKRCRLNGEIVSPQTIITVEDARPLIEVGYARKLTKEEARDILDEYAQFADRLFNEE